MGCLKLTKENFLECPNDYQMSLSIAVDMLDDLSEILEKIGFKTDKVDSAYNIINILYENVNSEIEISEYFREV